jgi:hypothetical protein
MIVAYVDNLGYLRCAPCADASDSDHEPKQSAVLKDAFPHAYEDCDVCHRLVNDSLDKGLRVE